MGILGFIVLLLLFLIVCAVVYYLVVFIMRNAGLGAPFSGLILALLGVVALIVFLGMVFGKIPAPLFVRGW